MSLQSRIEQLLDSYMQAFNARDLNIVELFQPRADLYTPFSKPAVGQVELRDLHEKWFKHGASYTSATIENVTARNGVAYCYVRYRLSHPVAGGSERVETGTSVNIVVEDFEGHWTFLCSSIFPD